MADIGDKLRSAREAKGLSIQDIEKATKIQSRYLTAIENDEFDKLPGDFYVRAFIRQYAQVVGLDGKELLSEYHQDVPESKPDEYVENSIDNKQEEVRETTNNKKDLWQNYLPKIGIGLGIIVAILVVYVLYARLSSGNQRNDNASNNVTVSSQTSSSSKKKTKPAVKTSSVKVSRLGEDEFRITGLKSNRKLVIKAGNQTVTASVSVNGNSQWSQTLAANGKHTMSIPEDANTVVVTMSNDTDSQVTVGGKKIPYTKKGSNLTLTLLIGKTAKRHSSSNNSTTTSSESTENNTTTNTTPSHSTNTQSQTHQSSQSQTETHQSSHQEQTHAQSSTPTQSSRQEQTQSSSTRQSTTQSSSAETTNNANNTENTNTTNNTNNGGNN
ncbi:helix-turn-helix domain-containing protein [Lactobacillus sp. LL6]|uniref:helix-turn-helix domain-containing protein n=1 Tax=Lactobacillus sp. LL6 TaxID=2596827 RepID=UPI001185971A|nr:helix-turn-helix domain-containing protein [Lactobacillus sp. LL6]TSO26006.1 helix-turn-helix domain-containing protein [Lactobacillus sp. LL6]